MLKNMNSFYSFLLFATLLTTIRGQSVPQQGGTLEDLIHEVFTPPPDGTLIGVISTSPPTIINNKCGDGGECVIYYQCANGTIITDGTGLIDIRIRPDEEIAAADCKDSLEVCCTLKSDRPITPPPPINKPEGCGYRNVDGVGFRISNAMDNEAAFAEFPWMVAILKQDPITQDKIYQCGGSLISPSVVLTGAHCVTGRSPNDLQIRVGEWDTQTTNEIYPHQDRRISEIVIHQQFHKGGLFNDVALLFLTEPVEIAENVNTVCLPPKNFNFDGRRCFASGWGKDIFGKEGKYQVILKKIDLPIVPRAECLASLRQTRLGHYFNLHESLMCAGGEVGKDTCKGDGGSPLVCPIPGTVNRYYQAGIVAWGIGCATQIPAMYANVALFRDWIDEQMSYKQIPTNSYNP